MRVSSTLILAAVLFLVSSTVGHANEPPKLAGIVTTDDCFTSFEGDGKKCQLGYCLSSVAGDPESSRSDKFSMCANSDQPRTVASQTQAEEEVVTNQAE